MEWNAVKTRPSFPFTETVGEREGLGAAMSGLRALLLLCFTLPGCDFISASRIPVISHLPFPFFDLLLLFTWVQSPESRSPMPIRFALMVSGSWRSSGDHALSLCLLSSKLTLGGRVPSTNLAPANDKGWRRGSFPLGVRESRARPMLRKLQFGHGDLDPMRDDRQVTHVKVWQWARVGREGIPSEFYVLLP
ncbi:hypothetical protein BJV78DRAFT_361818 [Lactifluus subvellereus]|nr:hypothetical protein BJV78DRAFT_361818 [Lactifluus subvellereus]